MHTCRGMMQARLIAPMAVAQGPKARPSFGGKESTRGSRQQAAAGLSPGAVNNSSNPALEGYNTD